MSGPRFCSIIVCSSWSVVLMLMVLEARAAEKPGEPIRKRSSVFYPAGLVDNAKKNAAKHAWAKRWQMEIVNRARPWVKLTDSELWDLMFGPTLPRSWDVCSIGSCPTCQNPVLEFSWHPDVVVYPWKMRCPICKDLYPKNDFLAYYRSGLDERNIFDPGKADRSLLYNLEHPDPTDPLNQFGVDDGNGYLANDGLTYRFIATYLIYGQWKQQVLNGIRRLAAAYVVTGEKLYAHKAGVLLDRVADLYPTFDFAVQECYVRGRPTSTGGFVSIWHDSCQETLTLSMSYDRIFDGIREDKDLVRFLSQKAQQHNLEKPKRSFADIQRNIETRILAGGQEPPIYLTGRKIGCNFPYTDVAMCLMQSIVEWPHCRDEVYARIDRFMPKLTQADGVSGEKGLIQYSSWPMTGFSLLLAEFNKLDPEFLQDLYKRYPRLSQTYKFYADLWCQNRSYYPNNGNGVHFGFRQATYLGALFQRPGRNMGKMTGWALTENDDRVLWQIPSMYSLFWNLYEVIGDPTLVKVLYGENDYKSEGLPWDLHAADPEGMVSQIKEVIARHGASWPRASVNKQEYQLAILRTGSDDKAPEAWLDYDNWGVHSDTDGMHLGLFAKGLDLLPDQGYWFLAYNHVETPQPQDVRAAYYYSSVGHNTVTVNGRSTLVAQGKTTLWADGDQFEAIRCAAPEMIGFLDYSSNPAALAREEAELLDNGSFEEDFAGWRVTGNGWTARRRGGVDGNLAYCGEMQTGSLSQTTLVTHRFLKWYAKGWDGSRHGSSKLNKFEIRDAGGKVLKTTRPPLSDAWATQIVDLYALGLKQGEKFTFTAVDGIHQKSYGWLAFDGIRQANREEIAAGPKQYERTVALVNLSQSDGYVLDIFRVVGGQDHAKFLRSHFGSVTTQGLSLRPTPGYEQYQDAFRNWQGDLSAQPGWIADWQIEDRYGYVSPGSNIHLRYTDLTAKSEAYVAENWIYTNAKGFEGQSAFGYPAAEAWVPVLMQRRRSTDNSTMSSTFVSIIEPYSGNSNIKTSERLKLETSQGLPYPESSVAIEIVLGDGRKDLLLAVDTENPGRCQPAWKPGEFLIQPDWNVRFDGELAWVRLDQHGKPTRAALGKARKIQIGEMSIELENMTDFIEVDIDGQNWSVVGH